MAFLGHSRIVLLLAALCALVSSCASTPQAAPEPPNYNCGFDIRHHVKDAQLREYDSIQGRIRWMIVNVKGGVTSGTGKALFRRMDSQYRQYVNRRDRNEISFVYFIFPQDTISGNYAIAVLKGDYSQFALLTPEQFESLNTVHAYKSRYYRSFRCFNNAGGSDGLATD